MTIGAPVGIDVPPESPGDSGETPIMACIPVDPTLWFRIGNEHHRLTQATAGCMVAPGSIEGVCLSCNCKIFIGPHQQRFPDFHKLCLVCALPLAVEGNKVVALKTGGES